LIETAETYGIKDDEMDMIRDIRSKLPAFTAGPRQYQEFGNKPGDEIYLWEGQPLTECHRHHSHLAGIYPFDTFDMTDAYTREALENAYRSWVDKGMGRWAGWSLPWASILHNRLGKPDMALFSLHILIEIYMMPGYATAHNGKYAGFTQFVGADVMQVEAAIAASAAVLEMYVQCVRGTIRIFTGLSKRFKEAAFSGIRAEGAFLLSGVKSQGQVHEVTVYAERDEWLRLVNPFSGKVLIARGGDMLESEQTSIAMRLNAGETVVFTAAAASVSETVTKA
jgi:alpha-L-fucosidase 2